MTKTDRRRSRIFISYRRSDTSGHVIALTDRLRDHFGPDRIFKDIDNLLPGEDFVAAIDRELHLCAIVLVVIGRDWLSIQDDRLKTRRLDNPKDYLRQEIRTALTNEHVRVIPVLVAGVSMPIADDLPADLQALSRRTAVELSDRRWDADVKDLIKTLESALEHIAEKTGEGEEFGPRRPRDVESDEEEGDWPASVAKAAPPVHTSGTSQSEAAPGPRESS